MKEYDYKKEYKKLLDDYHKLKSKSNVKSDEKTRKSAYKLLVAQNKAKHDIVCKWEKENGFNPYEDWSKDDKSKD